MEKWVCMICGYVYDPAAGDDEGGIPPGTPFEELPDDWTCPICGAGKDDFEKQTRRAAFAVDAKSSSLKRMTSATHSGKSGNGFIDANNAWKQREDKIADLFWW